MTMTSKNTHNDDERAQWIDNDEGLYDLWRTSGQPKRAEIDQVIDGVTSGDEPAHYLKYGG
jgi:uncharacterized protein YaeQ